MLAEVAFRGLVCDFNSAMVELAGLRPAMLRRRLEDIFAEHGRSGLLQPEEINTMAAVVFHRMDKNASGEICCREFIQACTDDGEISLEMMAHFFDVDNDFSRMRGLLDSTVSEQRQSARLAKFIKTCSEDSLQTVLSRMSEVAELSPRSVANHVSEKEVPHPMSNMLPEVAELRCCSVADHALEKARQPVSNIIPEEVVSTPELVKRVQDLEWNCEQALRALRDAVVQSRSSQQTPSAPGQPANVPPRVCPILSRSPHDSASCCTISSPGSASHVSHIPLPTSLFGSRISFEIGEKLLDAAAHRTPTASDAGDSAHSIQIVTEI